MCANKLVTARRAIENNNTPHRQVLERALWWRGLTALLSQCVPFSLDDVGRVPSAYEFFFQDVRGCGTDSSRTREEKEADNNVRSRSKRPPVQAITRSSDVTQGTAEVS
eukprot:240133-Pelagomonas_calceolata.AAC.1